MLQSQLSSSCPFPQPPTETVLKKLMATSLMFPPPCCPDKMFDTVRNIISVNVTYPASISDISITQYFSCLCFHSPATQMIDTARNIISVNVTYPASISEMARSFISSCLRKHSGDRPTVVELLQHPWIQMFKVCTYSFVSSCCPIPVCCSLRTVQPETWCTHDMQSFPILHLA